MKIPVLVFQGLVSLLFVAVPVYAIALGVILRCNATLRAHVMKAAAASAESYAALLSSEARRLERLCTVVNAILSPCSHTDFVKRVVRLLSLSNKSSSMPLGLYIPTDGNGDDQDIISYEDALHNNSGNAFVYLHCNGTRPMGVLDLERFSEEKGRPILLVDRHTGGEMFASRTLDSKPLLESAGDHVRRTWGNVSGQTCFWDGSTPVCLEPVDALDAVLVTREEVGMPRSMGAGAVAAVAAAMSVPLALFWVFTVAVGQAIRHISKDMRAVSALDFDPGKPEATTKTSGRGNTSSNNTTALWWKGIVPRILTKMHAGVRGLRMCVTALSSYVSPHLTREIIGGYQSKEGGGEPRQRKGRANPSSSSTAAPTPRGIAVMFVSLKDHGYLSAASNKGSCRVLNAFYRNFGEVICSCNGRIDKYINGSIMAIFDCAYGTDVIAEKDAGYENERRACTAAVLFRGALERTKEELAAQGDGADRARVAGLGYRVGVHCGVAYCGSIGYEGRADYTACGSEVNIASRIEAQADVYGVPALVSGSVADRVQGDFCCVPLDVVRLRGQNTAKTRLYHLVGEEGGGGGKSVKRVRERFYEIHRLARTGQYPRAVELIWRTLGDSAFRRYEKSLNVLLKNMQGRKNRRRHHPGERRPHESIKVSQVKRVGLNWL